MDVYHVPRTTGPPVPYWLVYTLREASAELFGTYATPESATEGEAQAVAAALRDGSIVAIQTYVGGRVWHAPVLADTPYQRGVTR